MIIDAKNLILGRMGTYVAKKALLGEKIEIVNCENSVITGDKNRVFEHYKHRYARGISTKGPLFYKMPDRFVKRSIRGMLPYKKDRGENAYKNIKCHIGVPESLKNQKFDTIKNADISSVPNLKYVSVKQICEQLGTHLQ